MVRGATHMPTTMIGLVTSAVAIGVTASAASAQTPPDVIVSAHRGGAAYAPENTMVAFENAIRLGVDEIEADAQLTSDGELVILHDDTLDRTTDCTGPVIDTVLADILACDAAYWFSPGQLTTGRDEDRAHPLRGTGVTVPTAEELLDLVVATPGIQASIEIKDIPNETNFDPGGMEIASRLVPLIVDKGLVDRVVVQSFWPPAIEAVKQMEPSIRTQFLTTSEIGVTASENVAYATSRMHDVSAPDFTAPDLTPDVVAGAQAAGLQVVPWTPDAVADLEATLALGVDGIITNSPACLLDLLGRSRPAGVSAPGVPPIDPCPADVDSSVSPTSPQPDPEPAPETEPTPEPEPLPATGGGVVLGGLGVLATTVLRRRRTVRRPGP